jgi:hypothetical protein
VQSLRIRRTAAKTSEVRGISLLDAFNHRLHGFH